MAKYIDIHTHNPREDVLSPTMAGVHPWDAERGVISPDFEACDIIGECGLDYACKVDRELQKELFRWHLDAADRLHKPVVLHVVKAMDDALLILDSYKTIKGIVFHGFIGSKEQAAACFRRGYYLSFGVRSLRSPKSVEALKITPRDRLFVETDTDRDTTIEELYNMVAQIRGVTTAELLTDIEKNYNELFGETIYDDKLA